MDFRLFASKKPLIAAVASWPFFFSKWADFSVLLGRFLEAGYQETSILPLLASLAIGWSDCIVLGWLQVAGVNFWTWELSGIVPLWFCSNSS